MIPQIQVRIGYNELMATSRFQDALIWAAEVYVDDKRKSSGAPAIHHPLGVCDLVMGAGGDEDTAIASLFHDFGEDKGGEAMLKVIERAYGERVVRIVRECSDILPTSYSLKPAWVGRKVQHIQHIKSCGDDSCLVLAADTLHNCRDHVRGFRENGMDWWKNFRANCYLDKPITEELCACSTHWYLSNKAAALNAKIGSNVLVYELYEASASLYNHMSESCQGLWAQVSNDMTETYGKLW